MNIYSILKKNKIDLDIQQIFQYSILDQLGKTILESNSQRNSENIQLSPGLYHLEINHEKGIVQQKIIISKE